MEHAKWKWLQYKNPQDVDCDMHGEYSSSLKKWCSNMEKSETNVLKMDTLNKGKESLRGTLIYNQKMEEQMDNHLFHYFLTQDFLITVAFDSSVLNTLEEEVLLEKMKRAENAIEGFFLIIGEIMSASILKIDKFELKLNDLLWKIKKKNSINRLEEIYQLRHELLVSKNLTIPIQEIKIGVEEAFGDGPLQHAEYKRTCRRIDRSCMLVNEYQEEIDTLVNFEEMVSTHRGNEIVKTLTVITTLFTPISAWGALWGMNFKYMPELDWRIGYPLSLFLIIGSTAAVYILLIKKGWMGDILKGKKKGSFFK